MRCCERSKPDMAAAMSACGWHWPASALDFSLSVTRSPFGSLSPRLFFAGLLYAFKRRETGMLRWMILAMWCGAVAGMTIFGINEEQGFAANQLHLIFVPLMTCYGLAYLLVQWNRLEIDIRLARIGFITLLFLLCATPMVFKMPGFK